MTTEHAGRGVSLPHAHTGSSYLYDLLTRATQSYSEALGRAALPSDPESFQHRYPDALARFEAVRVASPQRGEIARFLCREAARELRFVGAQGDVLFEEAMAAQSEPLPLLHVNLQGPGALTPAVRFEGRLYQGLAVAQLARELEGKRWMTRAARDALTWACERAAAEGGLTLRGRRFVLLGAAAELAPTDMLLEAGADVLWIDLRDPRVDRLLDPRLSGSLHYVKGGVDLLTAPQAVAATIREFAGDQPVHLCMYAYASGETQEFRLTAAMNAIARALPPSLLASVVALISPTTPSVVSQEDLQAAEERKQSAPGWKRTLHRTGQLSDGFVEGVARAVVPTQGVSYQAAQYLGKMLAAEAYATYGNRLGEGGERPLAVSANVAPITATRSLSHPLFEAAFLGAPLFDIWIAEPPTTRALAGLLMLHDVLNAQAPGALRDRPRPAARRAADLFTQQIHGGVYAQPYALQGCITVAALNGLAQKPGLALRIFR